MSVTDQRGHDVLVGEHVARDRTSAAGLLVIAVLVVLAVLGSFGVQRILFPYYSGDADEPVYRYQAQMLLDGEVTVPATQATFFRPWLSGPHDGHLVMAFTPGWPAVLAASKLVSGSMLPALGVAAALLTISAYLLAEEILESRRSALIAAAFVTLSPFVLLLSGTYLNYVFGTALDCLFAFLLLRGSRIGSRALLFAGGAVWGLTLATRPYDALLAVAPIAIFVLLRQRRECRRIAPVVGAAALGAAPLVIGTAIYNVLTGGSPVRFPTDVQSGGRSQFGWGARSLARGLPAVHFTVGKAVTSMLQNLWGLPTWLLGTYVALALAVLGALRMRSRDRRTLALLLGMTCVFPIGYLAWWASALTPQGAFTGIGPHYYLPVVVPLAILAAHAVAGLWEQRRAWRIAAAIGVVAVTVPFLPSKVRPKIDAIPDQRRVVHQVRDAVRAAGTHRAIVMLPAQFVIGPFPYLANDPRLTNQVLYAIDAGPRTPELLSREGRREAFRLTFEYAPGASRPRPFVKPLSFLSSARLVLHTHLVNTSHHRYVFAYIRSGDHTTRVMLDASSSKGRAYDLDWSIHGNGMVEYFGPSSGDVVPSTIPASGELAIGIGTADSTSVAAEDRAERRYYYRLRDGNLQMVMPDTQWFRFGPPINGALPVLVGDSVAITFG